MASYFAHSENSAGIKHDVVEHLKNVARLAGQFAEKFGAHEFGYWAGLWHDPGKFSSAFQGHIGRRRGLGAGKEFGATLETVRAKRKAKRNFMQRFERPREWG